MIEYVNADLTKAPQRYIVHGCNAQYKMGSGVALAIRKAFPDAYNEYMKAEQLIPGSAIVVNTKNKLIGNLITQKYYGYDGGRYAEPMWIKNALVHYIIQIDEIDNPLGAESNKVIAISKIGCSLGGLTWDEVEPVLKWVGENFNITFVVYEI